jgi:hypothetical protein
MAGDGVVSALSRPHRELLLRVADVLIPPTASMPSLRAADPTGEWLDRVCVARADLLADLAGALDGLAQADDLSTALRELHGGARATFDVLANFASGAYYLIPEVRALLGYPGQVRNPAPLDLASDELSDEVFEGAMNYPGTFRAAPAE